MRKRDGVRCGDAISLNEWTHDLNEFVHCVIVRRRQESLAKVTGSSALETS
jgi:hypothetical protein